MLICFCKFCTFVLLLHTSVQINALYNLFFFVKARFKVLVNHVFYFQSFLGEHFPLGSVC